MTLLSVSLPQVLYFFVLGACFGSFGNVLLCRLPLGEGVLGGRSHCPQCRKQIALYDNIPLLSFLALGGKCRHCKKAISYQYPIVEFVTACLFVYALTFPGLLLHQQFLLALCFWLLFLIAYTDALTQGIPDALNIPLIILALIFSISTKRFEWLSLFIGVGFLGLQWLVSRGKWVGSGDILLIAGIALLVGPWPRMLVSIFSSYILGSIIACTLILVHRKGRTDALAFAPFLTLGAFIAVSWGDIILWKLYGI